MYCPGCSAQTADDTKFCKQCGANLLGVREAMGARGEKFDWNKTWLAEMFISEEERDRRLGITPEKKRNNEIRGGVITTAVGLGVMIFLRYLFEAVAHQNGGNDAEIINRVWLAGVIPFLIGIAIIFNALVLGGRELKAKQRQTPAFPPPPPIPAQLEAKTTDQLSAATDFGVTEHTTAHLAERVPAQPRRENS
ncbi:MAG: hypothetical protein ABI977_18460 [Acidobacteriota bacterium]